ncbi:CaiB/BaiF CoA transferase family protein [Chloroflexota bacterium]
MNRNVDTKVPLQGIRVIDFTHWQAGPTCSLILAELGAEVIKVEPLEGEQGRWAGLITELGESLAFQARNRGKLSVTVNIKTELGKELVRDLVKTSDIFVENYRVGVLERLGFGYESLKALQPKIIMTSITGYGQYGPYANKPAHDPLMYPVSGIMSLTGSPDGPPMRVGVPIADRVAGINGALATLVALYRRAITGEGEHIDVALLDGMVFALDFFATEYCYNRKLPLRTGNRLQGTGPNGYFKCKDGAVFILASSDRRFRRLCEMMGKPELLEDPRFARNTDRYKHEDELHRVIGAWTGERTVEEVLQSCDQYDVEAAPVLSLPEVMENPQVKARKYFEELEHPLLGKTTYPGPLLKGYPTPTHMIHPAPLLGEHNGYVCRELLGYSEEKIRMLQDTGAICPKEGEDR